MKRFTVNIILLTLSMFPANSTDLINNPPMDPQAPIGGLQNHQTLVAVDVFSGNLNDGQIDQIDADKFVKELETIVNYTGNGDIENQVSVLIRNGVLEAKYSNQSIVSLKVISKDNLVAYLKEQALLARQLKQQNLY